MGDQNYLTPSQVNLLYPVAGMTVYGKVLVIRRFSRDVDKPRGRPSKAGLIEYLSRRSRSNFALTVARTQVKWLSLLTLTYGPNYPLSGRQVKSDWNAFITSFRRQFGKVRYFWFLEFQKRNAPHFHIGLDIGPIRTADRVIMADIWGRIAEKYNFPYSACKWQEGALQFVREDFTRDAVVRQHKRVKVWEDIREVEGALHYVVKYATKPYQKTVPRNYRDVGRFWSVSNNADREAGLTVGGPEADVREILKELGRNFDDFEMLPRVIFIT